MVGFAIAGLLAYFGYRLFSAVPQQDKSGGKIEAPGLTITLSRIGPGTFFAVCAAGIVAASFVYPIRITGSEVIGASPETISSAAPTVRQPGTASTSALEADAAHIRSALLQLACLRDAYPLTEDEQTAIDQARVALMGRLWREKWGEFEAFETWALERHGDAPVAAVEDLFTRKDPRCSS
jgi:hypothetical protein